MLFLHGIGHDDEVHVLAAVMPILLGLTRAEVLE
jgi:hypothetical protein